MKYDVFISYVSHDQKIVEEMCAYLEQNSLRCFVAYRDIPQDVIKGRAIVEALEDSRMMLVVFSNHYNMANAADREMELASDANKPIFTIRITNDDYVGAKRYYLQKEHCIDAFPIPQYRFGCLADRILNLIGGMSDVELKQVDRIETIVADTNKLKTNNIGDFYDVDGKQGVVFQVWNNGLNGKIVSLDQTKVPWDNRCMVSIMSLINNRVISAFDKENGALNTDIAMKRDDRSHFEAFTWCRLKGNSWYLPAIKELESLLLDEVVYNKVNSMLKSIKSATPLSNTFDTYISSTEVDAHNMYVISGFRGKWNESSSASKDINAIHNRVRAVSTF